MHSRLLRFAALTLLMACSASHEPSDPPVPTFGFKQVAIAGGRTCALEVHGLFYCWGPEDGDAEGFATVPTRHVQQEDLVELTGQGWLMCAVGISTAVYCDGKFVHGNGLLAIDQAQLGRVRDLGGMTVGMGHGCGLNQRLEVECFGSMLSGKVGRAWDPAGRDSMRYDWQSLSIPSGLTFRALAAGARHSCGITTNQLLYCWGDSANVGNPAATFLRDRNPCGSTTDPCTMVPVPVVKLTGVTALAAGQSHTCAVASTGLSCWGANFAGQLGTPGGPNASAPVPVTLPSPAVLLASGNSRTCAVARNEKVYCWGQWGGATVEAPNVVPGEYPRFTALAVGESHACGLAGGTAWCWGTAGSYLGNGHRGGSATPVAITLPVK